jgi:hypothetical protein
MRRIALVGTAGSGVNAPFDDPSYEIWGVSARGKHMTRANRWYELHRLEGEPPAWAANWRKTLAGFMHDIPELVMIYPEEDLAPGKVRRYPVERIIDRFGTFFMTSTFSWMFAEALDEMVPQGTVAKPGECEIAIFGVDMEHGTEYRHQRTGFRHFIDTARVLGVTVTRLATGGLSYEPVPYPMWQDDPLLQKVTLRNRESKQKIAEFGESQRMTRQMLAQNAAVRGSIEQSLNEGWDPQQRIKELEREHTNLLQTSARLADDIAHWNAVDQEQGWLVDYLQP